MRPSGVSITKEQKSKGPKEEALKLIKPWLANVSVVNQHFADLEDTSTGATGTKGRRHDSADSHEEVMVEVSRQDAYGLHPSDLMTEMEARGIKCRGFYQDDAVLLQAAFDEDHRKMVAARKQQLASQQKKEHEARAAQASFYQT